MTTQSLNYINSYYYGNIINNSNNHNNNSYWLPLLLSPIVKATTATTAATISSYSLNNISHRLQYSADQSNNDQTEENNDVDLIHNQFVQIIFCIIYATVFVLGVFGNVLVCYVVLRNRSMQTVTNIFITNLALSDILLCILAVPFTPLYTFMGRWAFGRTLCHLVSFAQGCSIYISTLTLTSIAVDRYFVIIHPFRPRMKLVTCIIVIVCIWMIALLATLPYGMYMKVVSEALLNSERYSNSNNNENNNNNNNNQGNSTIELILNTGGSSSPNEEGARFRINHLTNTTTSINGSSPSQSSSLSSPSPASGSTRSIHDANSFHPSSSSSSPTSYLQLMKEVDDNIVMSTATSSAAYCEENWPSEHYRKIFGSLTTILQFVLPFFIISICYIWVSIKLNARARAKPGTKSSRRDEADRDRKKRTNRMLIAMVAVFGLSWLPLNLVNIFDDFYEKSNEWPFYTLFFFVAHSIAMSSTCYNPFLYAWLNENFRKEFKHVLPCFDPSHNVNAGLTRGHYNRGSERNTCGPRLRNGSRENGEGNCTDFDELDENGLTQETTLPKEKIPIIPREPTYGNGKSACGGSEDKLIENSSTPVSDKHPRILLNDREECIDILRRPEDNDSIDDEHTVEMRFIETPFVSSDNATGISIMIETSTSNEAEYSNQASLIDDRGRAIK